MPDRQSYDEAMLFARVRLKVPDPELKQGKVETYTLQSAQGSYERPWGIEGGFAVVYKFRTKSGRMRALRCYRVTMNDDTQFRYERLSPYFRTYVPSITTNFTYHRDAILVKEQGKLQPQIFPLIEMDWIEGDTLIERVETLCQQRNTPALGRLSQEWLRVLKMMQQAHIAHGDLAGVNVMVRDDATLVLIDYDGVYIPPLAGLPQTLLGQVDYQHPAVAQRAYDEHMDDFSALVIYTALLALSVQPTLWFSFNRHDAAGKLQDTNLLFTQDDFKRPQQSALFQALEDLGDQRLSAFTQALKRTCQEPIDRIRFPFDLIDPVLLRQQALNALEQAIRADDDALIVARWVPALEQHEPARMHLERLRLARLRLQLSARFRAALQQRDLQQIVAGYDAVLDTVRSISSEERALLSFARACVQAYQSDNKETFLHLVEDRQNAHLLAQVTLTAQEQDMLGRARQVRQVWQSLQEVLRSKENAERIVSMYNDALLNSDIRLTEEQQELVDAARSYLVMRGMLQIAIRDGDDTVIQRVYNAELARRFGGVSESEQKQIDRVLLSKTLEELLEQGDYGRAIQLAQQIQQLSGRELQDSLKFRLRKAIMRFIRQQNLSGLIVSIKQQAGGNYAVVQWRWPMNTLVQDGLIAWSPVSWPQRPHEQQMQAPDPWHVPVRRKNDQMQGRCEFPIGHYTHMYVQAFAALADYWDRDRTWRFSDGSEATSKVEVVGLTASR